MLRNLAGACVCSRPLCVGWRVFLVCQGCVHCSTYRDAIRTLVLSYPLWLQL